MNFQSTVGKSVLDNHIDFYKPNIIIGTETWFKPTISSSEVFSSHYQVIRKDRHDGYGRVLIAYDKTLPLEEVPIASTCEIVASKLQTHNNQSLIIIAVYRPPNHDLNYYVKH